MENEPFEDLWHIENDDFPLLCFTGKYCILELSSTKTKHTFWIFLNPWGVSNRIGFPKIGLNLKWSTCLQVWGGRSGEVDIQYTLPQTNLVSNPSIPSRNGFETGQEGHIAILFVRILYHKTSHSRLGVFHQCNIWAPENGWLEDDPASFWGKRPIFRGELLVSGSVYTKIF